MKRIKKLLLVNDNFVINYLISQLMQETDIVQEFIVTENGMEAFIYLTEHCTKEGVFSLEQCPDVILLNLEMMPQMGGLALMEEMRSMGMEALLSKVVMLRSGLERGKYGNTLPFGIRRCLDLPITEERLYWLANEMP